MMTRKELLQTYRSEVLALRDLEAQLDRMDSTGAPVGCRNARLSEVFRATNDPMHAALQLQDGLEAMAAYKRETLAELNPQIMEVLSRIDNSKLMQVIFHYYVEALTLDDTAKRTFQTIRSVQRMKHDYLARFGGEAVQLMSHRCHMHVTA